VVSRSERPQRARLIELGDTGVVDLDADLLPKPGQLVLQTLQMVKQAAPAREDDRQVGLGTN
jgi:hypothetical protein